MQLGNLTVAAALWLLLLLIQTASVCAQAAVRASSLSPLSRQLLYRLAAAGKQDRPPALNKDLFVIRSGNRGPETGAILRMNPALFSEAAFAATGGQIQSRIGNLLTVRIPIMALAAISQLPGIEYIEIDAPLKPRLFAVRQDIRADWVHRGDYLPKPFKGQGVLIGIIDAGFDYSHPTFRTIDGKDCRIRKIWDQRAEICVPPKNFSYGCEWVSCDAITKKGYDIDSDFHGTHVAGIAAGSGFGTQGIMQGVAPAAEMVLVTYSGAGSSIIDGINYVYQIADSLNRPAVINLSLGSHIGPHDGTSLLDQALSSLIGSPGKIIVGAAGNEGDKHLFLSKTFGSGTDTTNLISLVEFEDETGTGVIDMWGETGSSFEAQLLIYDALGNLLQNTGFVSSTTIDSIGTGFEYFLDGRLVRIIFVGTPAASINGKPNLLVAIENAGNLRVALEVKAGAGNTVRCWNHGLGSGAGFSNEIRGFRLQGFTPGSNQSTVGEIGSTAKGIISVGAYTTQNEYADIFGFPRQSPAYAPNGALAPFSSQGPTADGRTKPDITAPGNVVISAMSRFYLDAPTEILVPPRWYEGNISWGYAALPGTSMAAPVISGVAALLLEADKNLTADQLLAILQRTAGQDKFTDTSSRGKNLWGGGKVNAWAALQDLTGYTTLDRKQNNALHTVISPNPSRNDAILYIFTAQGQTLDITLYDIAGRKLEQFVCRSSDTMFSQLLPADLASGIYLVQIRSNTGLQQTIRWVVE